MSCTSAMSAVLAKPGCSGNDAAQAEGRSRPDGGEQDESPPAAAATQRRSMAERATEDPGPLMSQECLVLALCAKVARQAGIARPTADLCVPAMSKQRGRAFANPPLASIDEWFAGRSALLPRRVVPPAAATDRLSGGEGRRTACSSQGNADRALAPLGGAALQATIGKDAVRVLRHHGPLSVLLRPRRAEMPAVFASASGQGGRVSAIPTCRGLGGREQKPQVPTGSSASPAQAQASSLWMGIGGGTEEPCRTPAKLNVCPSVQRTFSAKLEMFVS